METGLTKSSFEYLAECFSLPDTDIKEYSPLTLAYIGDAVYEIVVRTVIVKRNNVMPQKLHKKSSNLVKASTQARIAHGLLDVLSDEEMQIFRSGRNAKPYTRAKNATMADYHAATGLEAVVGYLYLTGRHARLIDIMAEGIALFEKENNIG